MSMLITSEHWGVYQTSRLHFILSFTLLSKFLIECQEFPYASEREWITLLLQLRVGRKDFWTEDFSYWK